MANKKTKTKKVIAKKTTKKPVVKKLVPAKKNVKKVVAKKIIKQVVAKKSKSKLVKSKIIKTKKVENKKPIKKIENKKSQPIKKNLVKNTKKIDNSTKKSSKAAVIKSEPIKLEAAKKEVVKKPGENNKNNFKAGEHIIYPSHGVGKVAGIENINILGKETSFYLLSFEKEKLTIKIPVDSARKAGVRNLANKAQLEEILAILRNGVKKTKGMWSRRAQEYETKINSGDIILLAEVLRDLTRDIEDSDRSYSERIIYETAINRLACEYSAVYGVSFEEARDKIITVAKDKLVSEGKPAPKKDDFDDFDAEEKDSEEEDEELEEEEEEEEDDDYED